MNRNMGTGLRIIHNCIWLFMLSYFLGSCYLQGNEAPDIGSFIPVIPIVLYSFAADERADNFLMYLLFQLPACVLFFAAGKLCDQSFSYLAILFVTLLCQILDKRTPLFGPTVPRAVMLFFFAAVYFIGMALDDEVFLNTCAVCLMADIIIYILYNNQEGIRQFLDVRKNTSGIPYRQVGVSNRLFIAGVSLVLLLIFVLSTLFMDNSLLKSLAVWLVTLIKNFLKSLIKQSEAENGTELVPVLPDDIGDVGHENNFSQPPEGSSSISPIWDIIAGVILTVVLILIIVGIVSIIIKVSRSFSKRRVKAESEEETEDEVTDIRSEVIAEGPVYAGGSSGIRKRYRHEILKKRKKNKIGHRVNVSYTPSQIERESLGDELTMDERKYWDNLHASYEQERYGS